MHSVISAIILAHRFFSPPGWYSDEYALARSYYGIVYVLDGYAEYTLGDGSYLHMRGGDCLYVPKGTVYTLRCRPDQPFVHMTVNFAMQPGDNLPDRIVKQKLSGSGHLEQLFTNLVRHWVARHPFYQERCIGILYELLFLVLREIHASAYPYQKKLQPACRYLDEHFREDFPLEQLARLCGFSETYFRRLFHRTYHETPAEYRRRLRIASAVDLLLTGQYSISEIARLCGYPDPAYFSRMFRKTMGSSPSQFLKQPRLSASEAEEGA